VSLRYIIDPLEIRFKKLRPEAHMPTYAYSDDAGMDLYSAEDATIFVSHGKLVTTGLALEIPLGFFGLIRPRSGIAKDYKVTMISSGVIDSGYRGEVKVQLHNHGTQRYEISAGDRIAQLLIIPVVHATLEEVSELSKTVRRESGHGSSGK
jgi:dUTP pyrophosphatase